MNAALLILRVVPGLGLASHGSQKPFGCFGGGGISGTGVFLESIGFRPGSRFALAAGWGEFLGGLLLACAFLGPIGPALIVSVILAAILTVHKGHGFFAFNNGPELPIIYITGAVAVALAGSGYYSTDHAIGSDSSFSEFAITIILSRGVLAALASLAVRHSPELAAKSSQRRFAFDAGHFRSAVDGTKSIMSTTRSSRSAAWVLLSVMITTIGSSKSSRGQGKESSMNPTLYRTIQVDGLSIFYREAGPKNAETLLLLHGLPSSSRMFEPLFARLSNRYHLIAPDYPGFGHSDWPDPKKFAYTFDHYADIVSHFTEALGLSRYTLYMQDYGGPVGFRMALAHPERIEALIVQDAVAHNEGLGANWKTRRAFWADRAANESALRTNLLSLETTRSRHVGNDPDVQRHDPDLWTDEFYFLNRPGQAEIQSDLFYDYRTNVEDYPKWQAWMREKQPPLLVIWGKYEVSFDPSEPESYREDVPSAEVHVVDGGHFALDTAADEIAALVRDFMVSLPAKLKARRAS